MTPYSLKSGLLLFLLLFSSCASRMFYNHSCRTLILEFKYENYIGKSFGEFHRDFKAKAEKKRVEVRCGLYYPKPGLVRGTKLDLGNGYAVSALTNSRYYVPDYHDTVPKCYECSCIQNDTAKIVRIELLKNNEIIRIYPQ